MRYCETKHCQNEAKYYINGEDLCEDCYSATDTSKRISSLTPKTIRALDKKIKKYEKK